MLGRWLSACAVTYHVVAAVCYNGPALFLSSGMARSLRSHRGELLQRYAASDEKVEVVYNYFAQEYTNKPTTSSGTLDVFMFLADLLPWSSAELDARALIDERTPNWRKSPFGPSDDAEFRRNFRAISEAAGSEMAALSVLDKNPAVILFGPNQVRTAGSILKTRLGGEEAAKVIQKNPGVLTIDAQQLQDNMDSVVLTANVIDLALRNGSISRFFASSIALFFAVAIGKALLDVIKNQMVVGSP